MITMVESPPLNCESEHSLTFLHKGLCFLLSLKYYTKDFLISCSLLIDVLILCIIGLGGNLTAKLIDTTINGFYLNYSLILHALAEKIENYVCAVGLPLDNSDIQDPT